ncbi:MAG TPA: hypothetical protein VFI47_03405, partial [Acidimicrobiales bacterium]|nr:hypothetical protein [Acidimicrobiales bacterium]
MVPSPPRTLEQALAAALAAGPAAGGDRLGRLRDGLDHAARAATARGGWTDDEPLRLTKGVAAALLRCPRRAVAADPPGAGDDLIAGLVVDAAAKLATLVPQRRATLDGALAYLAASGDEVVRDHLDALGPAAG